LILLPNKLRADFNTQFLGVCSPKYISSSKPVFFVLLELTSNVAAVGSHGNSTNHTDARIIIIDASPRMNLIDDPSFPNIIVIFELPGVRNENIILQMKDGQFIVIGTRDDPSAEALVAAKASPPTSTDSGGTDTSLDLHDNPENSLKDVPDDSVVTCSTKPLIDGCIRELRYGSFFRSIALPEGIKVSLDVPSTASDDSFLNVEI